MKQSTGAISTPTVRSQVRIWAGFAMRLIFGLSLMLVVPQILNENLASSIGKLQAAIVSIVATMATFVLFIRVTEGAWSKALGLRGAFPEWIVGVGFGALLSCISVGMLSVLGLYQILAVADPSVWVTILIGALPVALLSGFVEELAIRGVVARQIARSFSPLAALVVSAALFGVIHLANENATPIVGVGLIAQAGILLGAAYFLTGRLWFVSGLHFSWNYMQAAIFGSPLSGNAVSAIVTAERSGPAWISGGAFGIEGSALTTAVCFIAALCLIWLCTKRGLPWFAPRKEL